MIRLRASSLQALLWRRACVAVLALVLSIGVDTPCPTQDAVADDDVGIHYVVRLNVPAENGLKALIQESSQLKRLKDSPPTSVNALQRRIESDLENFREVMRSKGYYDPDIRYELIGDAEPYTVDISIAPGPIYTLAVYDIVFLGGPPDHPNRIPDLSDGGITLGEEAIASNLTAAEGRLVRWLKNRGHPFAQVSDRLAMANHPDQTVWIQLTLDAGPLVTFGALEIEGLVDVDRDVVTSKITWQEGEIYDQRKVDAMRDDLLDTTVFDRVLIRPEGDRDDPPGERSMLAKFTEALPRSIGAGLSYSKDLGPELEANWEHRNLFGGAQVLSLRMVLGLERQRIDSTYRQPDYLRDDQDLVIRTNLLNEELEAFTQIGIAGSASLEWPVNGRLRSSWGVALDFLEIDDTNDVSQSILLGLPVTYIWDRTDSLLDPTQGFRLDVNATPWAGEFNGAVGLLSTSIEGSTYVAFDSDARVVLALRSEFGTILGEDIDRIPSNRRFFAGGGGSIRGYEFQKVGPLDSSNDPIGGRSLLVGGAELRIKITEDIGIVPFYEGGNVFSARLPDLHEDFFFGAGLGLRYYTAVGPIRLDVAVPLDRRKNIDDPFQLYISLGQAF